MDSSVSNEESCSDDMMITAEEPVDAVDVPNVGSAKRFVRQFYSTTSSVYLQHTIRNPNSEQILFCLATVYQAQLFDDAKALAAQVYSFARPFPQFDLIPSLPPELGGDLPYLTEQQLDTESCCDELLRRELAAGTVPPVDTICRFMSYVQSFSRHPVECNIIAIFYFNRIASRHNLPLTRYNWRLLWASVVNLAQKVWDDRAVKSLVFADNLPPVTRRQFHDLECLCLTLLDYRTAVTPAQYTKYYLELAQLFAEIVGERNTPQWRAKPLSVRNAMLLDDRCQRSIEKRDKTNRYSDDVPQKKAIYVIS